MEVRELDSKEIEGFEYERHWVQDLLNGHKLDIKLTKQKEDIPTLHTLIDNGPYTDQPESELQIFGTVFGDILANELNLRWVVVSDEDGADFALQYKDREIFLFPKDMIIKRVENDVEINLSVMLKELTKTVNDLINDTSIK